MKIRAIVAYQTGPIGSPSFHHHHHHQAEHQHPRAGKFPEQFRQPDHQKRRQHTPAMFPAPPRMTIMNKITDSQKLNDAGEMMVIL
jgi:hypothetical protein